MRGKSTTQSHRTPIYYVDLTVRSSVSLAEAIGSARTEYEARKNAGFDQAALDEAARLGFAAGAFEESEEEGVAVIEEFFPYEAEHGPGGATDRSEVKPGLADKLNRKAASSQRTAVAAAGE